ncbi:hypothetical protein P153DRAFT_128193 [Dothidotthia symphoricarpi CBS 119687]|uniref:Uncharacterized protein n=1 Tax=Dothidotthia symphoricarpi CBS 119687 TaxID=1392245 RepID=A0A6A5ZZ16_9PLEO|nr:uncharacterized protein P153DRAFT_128193 [Dothidotthia symphoricarpi CBS 119687]KAF2124809.1 hypothetical protein P153DRAFT_128193 [Dothidotthia symphoricarpi CBS 119687]
MAGITTCFDQTQELVLILFMLDMLLFEVTSSSALVTTPITQCLYIIIEHSRSANLPRGPKRQSRRSISNLQTHLGTYCTSSTTHI